MLYMFAGRTSIVRYQLFFCLSPLYFIMLSQSKDAIFTTILSQSQDAIPITIRSLSKDAIPTTILSAIRFWKNTRHFDKERLTVMVNIQRLKLSTNIDKTNNFSPQVSYHKKDHDKPIEIQALDWEMHKNMAPIFNIWINTRIFSTTRCIYDPNITLL